MRPVLDAPKRGFDVLPTALVLQGASERLGYERAAPPQTDLAIQLRDEVVPEAYVQSHGPHANTQTLSDNSTPALGRCDLPRRYCPVRASS